MLRNRGLCKREIKTNDLTVTTEYAVLRVNITFSCLSKNMFDLFVIVVYSSMQLHNVTLALDLLIDRGLPVQSIDPQGNYFGTIQTLAVSIDC